MTYDRHYTDPNKTREQLDEDAINDIHEYFGGNRTKPSLQWTTLLECVNEVNQGSMTVQQLNFAFGLAGISGRPFHAFCRKYCLEKYKEWCRSTSGGEPIEVDDQGFWI